MVYIRFTFFSILMLFVIVFMHSYHDHSTMLQAPFSAFPTSVGEWHMIKDSQFDQRTLDVLRPTDYIAKRYLGPDGAVVDLYIGYHDGASQAGPLHSPKNCLPGAGWYEASSAPIRISFENTLLDAIVAVYVRELNKEIFIYWFQVGGVSVSNEYAMKFYEIFNSFRYGRRDTAFIRISVPITDSEEHAQQLGKKFLKEFYPAIQRFLPS